ncbi:MAG: FecR domain-containing protein [Chitinophagaceae bacterium]|nr:FecR domain-containing protein [Chitinophagaceae bacterium]
MKVTNRIQLLLTRYAAKTITSAELDELLVWMEGLTDEQSAEIADAYQELWQQAINGDLAVGNHAVDWNAMLNRVKAAAFPKENKKPVYRIWIRAAAAAVIVLFGATVTYVLLPRKQNQPLAVHPAQQVRLPESVLPNTNQTMLTFEDGHQIFLDSMKLGNIATDNSAMLVKLGVGEIAYGGDNTSSEPTYHTISVPRGGRPYIVALADGSKVWLNAESSLRYPSFFKKDEPRKVELTGEGYFEIAPQFISRHSIPNSRIKTPFFVKLPNMSVEVLGTHFNIMAYRDEQFVETTLLEGSVKIGTANSNIVLAPGKQAQLDSNGKLRVINADTALATAWVNGYFHFDKADVKTVLRQVGRWYDLDVVYNSNMPDDLFSGKMEKSLPLSGILKLFESSPVKLRVEGRKLIVLPVLPKN